MEGRSNQREWDEGKGSAKMVERKLKPLDRDLPQDESNTYRLYLELDFYTVEA